MRVGILGYCPPPYGGVTRVIEDNTRFWAIENVKSYLLPRDIPQNPKPPVGVELIDWRQHFSLNRKILSAIKESARFLGLRSYSFIKYNLALYNVLVDLDVDILYAHHAFFNGWSSVFQSSVTGIPTVLVSYGETWMVEESHRKLYPMQRYVLEKADAVISTSEHCRRGAINIGADPAKTNVVYAGIDIDRFSPSRVGKTFRRKHKINEDKIVISMLGLMLRRKMDTFFNCLSLLKKFEKRIMVLIGGTGADLEYYRLLLEKSDLQFVKLLGFVPEEELPHFYNATDIFVVSPHTKTECMGLSMKEAMSCGVPIVGAAIGGVPEAIEDGKTGFLFSPGSARDLVAKIEILINNEDLRKKIGERARKFAADKFDARLSAKRNLEIFTEVLKDRKGRRKH